MTAEQIARADKVAREIESTSSSNSHLREERGQIELNFESILGTLSNLGPSSFDALDLGVF